MPWGYCSWQPNDLPSVGRQASNRPLSRVCCNGWSFEPCNQGRWSNLCIRLGYLWRDTPGNHCRWRWTVEKNDTQRIELRALKMICREQQYTYLGNGSILIHLAEHPTAASGSAYKIGERVGHSERQLPTHKHHTTRPTTTKQLTRVITRCAVEVKDEPIVMNHDSVEWENTETKRGKCW